MALTDTQIRKLKPTEQCTPTRPDKYSDGDNLRLWVRHTGAKVWVYDYSYNGKRQSLTLGKYPFLTIAGARARLAEIQEQLANGINPKDVKRKNTVSLINTFDHHASAFYAYQQKHLAASTYRRAFTQYERDIKPFIGSMDIGSITAPDILQIAKRIEARGAGDMAKRAIRKIGQVFKQAIREGHAKYDPTTGLTEAIKPHKVKHHARIEFEDLPQLLNHVDQYRGHPVVKWGLYFLCYTFVRTQELRFMTWQEIDFNARLWRLSPERMKKERPHIVPLSPQAMAILEHIRALGLSDTYVFYNTSTRKAYSENAFLNALYRMGYKGIMTGHGFRGLASTVLHERQYQHAAIELQLAHDDDDKVSKAYNGAELLPYRVKMMNDWADMVDHAKTGLDNIVYVDFTKQA